MVSSAVSNDPNGWYNLTKRVMQLNASPTLAAVASPALHKDHWQQRRYTFLSKNSMFGGELKDEVVNEQGSDVEQRPIIGTPQMTTSGSIDSEGSNAKRESILGMAVTGVRNLLADDEQPIAVGVLTKQDINESNGLDEHDAGNIRPCTQCTQTDADLPPTSRNRIKTPIKKIYSRLFHKPHPSKKTN
jgi:hypothetical protein